MREDTAEGGGTRALAGRLREALGEAVLGQEEVLDEVLVAVLVGGHVLLEGVPGLAKTRLLRRLADSLALKFRRIQMTPDLMPTDVTGTVILSAAPDGERQVRFLRGPIFADLVLADEINRAPPKTQAALLEAMEERQVTIGGEAHPLGPHFLVVATQNPIEQEGTYPLPLAQADRFLLKILVGYPDRETEEAVARQGLAELPPARAVLAPGDIDRIRAEVSAVVMPEPVESYILDLVRATRPGDPRCPPELQGTIGLGAGVRASQALDRASRAVAWLDGRPYVHFRDVTRVAQPVLRHRLILRTYAAAEGTDADAVVRRMLNALRHPPLPATAGAALRRLVPAAGGGA